MVATNARLSSAKHTRKVAAITAPIAREEEPAHKVPPSLFAKWEVVQHSALTLAQLAYLDAQEASQAVELQPNFARLRSPGDQRAIAGEVDALVAVLLPQARLLTSRERLADQVGTSSAALKTWCEFRRAQKRIVAQCNGIRR